MRIHFLALTLVAFLAPVNLKPQSSAAQTVQPTTAPGPPVPLKRVAPPRKPVPSEQAPAPDKYPFTDLINVLQGDSPTVPSTRPRSGSTASGSPSDAVPRDFKPASDIPLAGAAKEAVQVSQGWMQAAHAPVEGKDGQVVYTYGAGLPTVVCAPLRVCVLELQAGEKLVGEPQIGDSVRWIISPASSGEQEFAVPMIVIKPKVAGLDTDLLVTTDRRAYYVRLISKPEEYLVRVAFTYPDDEDTKWRAFLAREQERQRREASESSEIAPIEGLENLYFDYTVRGGDANMRPVRVVDDGKKTFIQVPPEAAHRELPALAVVGPDGKADLVNYRVKGDMYIVDRIFDRGALILGAGKKAQRAEIIRGTGKDKKPRRDPYADVAPESGASPSTPSPKSNGDRTNDNARQEGQP